MTDKTKKANSQNSQGRGVMRRQSHKAGAAGVLGNPLLIWGTLGTLVVAAFAVVG